MVCVWWSWEAIEDTHQLKKDPESLKIYFKDGAAIKDSIFKRPDLDKLFQLIATEARKAYEGDIAKNGRGNEC